MALADMSYPEATRRLDDHAPARWLAALVTVLAMGCEHGVDLVGELHVPPLASDDGMRPQPAQIVVAALMSDGTEFWTRPAPWCEAPGRATTLSVRAFDFGCAGPATARVTAWVYSVDTAVDCTDRQFVLTEGGLEYPTRHRPSDCYAPTFGCPPRPERVLVMGTSQVTPDVSWSVFPCRDAVIPISLTLVPAQGSP